ncbi:MAG: class I SAM-dependent methyltransferase [Bacteroidetes bacterium]|nr:class I SAM-dependent methyltransferase [Bacteroidota bacterium]
MSSEPIQPQIVAGFYDDYTQKQQKTGTNLRHYYLFHRLKRAGLKRHHHVLEVGCGIGTLTRLIHRYVSRGHVVAADISEKSIEMANKRFGNASRIEFLVTDMQNFTYPEKFDFIVLPDVLEHIPIEQHRHLFGVLRAHMHDDSVIFINIPHSRFIEYFKENCPEKLQIIDQALQADLIVSSVCSNDLVLLRYNSYSLFHKENDYVELIIITNNKLIKPTPISSVYIIFKKLIYRVLYLAYF